MFPLRLNMEGELENISPIVKNIVANSQLLTRTRTTQMATNAKITSGNYRAFYALLRLSQSTIVISQRLIQCRVPAKEADIRSARTQSAYAILSRVA